MSEEVSILVVDDDACFRSTVGRFARLMEKARPLRVTEAASGGEAAAMLTKGEKPDCVLLDNRMAGGNGVGWLPKLLCLNSRLAIIMVTGEGDEETAVQAMKRGAVDYLPKETLSPATLWRAVTNAIEKSHMRAALDKQRQALLKADRDKVLMSSLVTACHQVGQPATAILAYLELMKKARSVPEISSLVDSCLTAAQALDATLKRLQRTTEYRTVPALSFEDETDLKLIAV